MRSTFLALLLIFPLFLVKCSWSRDEPSPGVTEWPYYGGDPAGNRYSALTQINKSNVSSLQVAWTYHTGERRFAGKRAAQMRNPFTSSEDVAAGKQLYDSLCTTCHVEGGTAPVLKRHELRFGKSDAALFGTIFDGLPQSEMPGLFESEETVWQVVAYVRSLLPEDTNPVPPASEDPKDAGEIEWTSAERYSVMECTPIVADGVMYIVTLLSRVQALDPTTGEVIWTFDPFQDERFHGLKRGVTYWAEGNDKRIYYVAGPRLWALDARTGQPLTAFGDVGSVELAKGYDREGVTYASYNTPVVISQDVIIVGNALYANGQPKLRAGVKPVLPEGAIVAYNLHTGKRAWIFHTIPFPGESGYETWPPDAWRTAYGANSWGGMTVDVERGLVFAGTAAPYYEPPRYGKNLFANTILALDAKTGERVWHFQTIHHDVWDLDIPCPPNLVTLERDGHRIDAVAQAGKNGLIFVLHRETGEPIFPVEERPVETANWPGEEFYPTQPFPVKPPPLSAEKFEVTDISPEARQAVLEKLENFRYGDFYEPFETGKGTILYPSGITGGVDYGGGSFDPIRGWLVLNSNDVPWIFNSPGGGGQLLDHQGYPGVKPPWGRLTAVDLNEGEIVWRVPFGEYPELTRRGISQTGTENMGGTILTASGLIFVGATQDKMFRAFDIETGEKLWEYELPAVASATPATYEVDGKQYVVIAAGGGGGMQQVNMLDAAGPFAKQRQRLAPGDAFVAFALPD